ncbi:T9SS type A sorting domain-containing protein [Flavobacterium ginsenosidimutans]|uniref:T9SS type A sorting domain-containing protein n=1 Tax=Flavobacterium ginsenosidimutans TaxID=687844 RepID=UPI000DABDBBF|nr:T9SS type A sorting domain-containing protein [Flavobacterium ginsenosidimutans]KAF2335426.1 T9SS type A sorting domain-containing protein [Flavobacterium ginsenosidimutans]
MKKIFTVIIFFVFTICNAQQKINFTYDAAGNQIIRALCISGCTGKPAKEIKEIEALVEEDMEKFYPEDAISYYPNPVKEELFLKWLLSSDNYVSSINIISVTGEVLKQYQIPSDTDTQNIPFQQYSTGFYIVLLKYNNGEQKSIKIIKN